MTAGIEMDRETFVTMWSMSGVGTDAEHCFLRIPQTEYYAEEHVSKGNGLEVMPGVSWTQLHPYFSQKY